MKKSLILLTLWVIAGFVMTMADGEEWLTNLEQAINQAKKDNLDILVDFTGSDWCGWCQKLDKEVFQTKEWKEQVGKKYVLVSLDFPQEKELSEEQKAYNEKLAKQYSIQGFPTICLLDSNGKIYAKTGYQKGGPIEYFKHLEELAGNKTKRDELSAKIEKSSGKEQLAAIGEFLTFVEEKKIGFAYIEVKEKAVLLDTDNQAGYALKFSEELYESYIRQSTETTDVAQKESLVKKADGYLEIIKKYDSKKANNAEIAGKDIPFILENILKKEKWEEGVKLLTAVLEKKPTGEVGQACYYFLGLSYYRMGDKKSALKSLEDAVALDPNGDIGQRLSQVLEGLKEEIKADEEAKKAPAPTEQPEQPKENEKVDTPK